MYNKKVMISDILNAILATTGSNFQKMLADFLYAVCQYKNIDFEKVEPTNGDAKNDGWIPTQNIYFAMYSPSDSKISQIKAINNKLNSDLDGLCMNIFNLGKWGKDIKKFYLIVNIHDQDLPADPDRILETTISKIKKKYQKDFEAKVIAAKDIKYFLLDADIKLIDRVANYLEVYKIEENITVIDIMSFIDKYISFLATKNVKVIKPDYSRIKIEDKITLNHLYDTKSRILNLIDASDKVDQYLSFINSEGLPVEEYEKIKDYIIQTYLELSSKYEGDELYNNLVDTLLYESMLDSKAIILEALIVNIFIKCDIFRKE